MVANSVADSTCQIRNFLVINTRLTQVFETRSIVIALLSLYRSPTKESPTEDEQDDEEEHLDEDNTDVASSEEQTISNPFVVDSALHRATPSYVSIRRPRPSISSR